jgi:flagellar biosynthesis/type III secretory pathway chaperone
MRKPEELLPILDEQIAFVQQKLSLLQAMADRVVQADLAALEDLLRGEEALQENGAALDDRLEELRSALAAQAGVPARGMTLQRLAESLGGRLGIQLADRRERLMLLLEAVQQESGRTAALVRHALELNQRMVDALMGTSGQGPLYSAAGQLRSETNQAVLRHCV